MYLFFAYLTQNFFSKRSCITSYFSHPQHGNKAAWFSDNFIFRSFLFLLFVLLKMAIDLMNSEYCSGYTKNYLCKKPSIYELLQYYKNREF